MLLRIAICDDILENARALEQMLRQEAAGLCLVETECFRAADELFEGLGETAFDLVFLDIQLEQNQDGISVARQLNALYPELQIVFITAYLQYAVSIYDAAHTYFLVKPVSEKRLRRALEQAIARLESSRAVRFALPVRGAGQRVFTASEVEYFERHGHTTLIHTAGGTFGTAEKLSDIEPLLPEDSFVRPHNSYLVNLARVCGIDKNKVALRGGVVLPVSNAHRTDFTAALVRSIAGAK